MPTTKIVEPVPQSRQTDVSVCLIAVFVYCLFSSTSRYSAIGNSGYDVICER